MEDTPEYKHGHVILVGSCFSDGPLARTALELPQEIKRGQSRVTEMRMDRLFLFIQKCYKRNFTGLCSSSSFLKTT